MNKSEIEIVSRYAAAELAGALVLGMFSRRTANPYLRDQLTFHCFEESRHAWLWTKFLRKRGLHTVTIHERDPYFEYLYTVRDEIHFLAAIHVFELRLPFHFPILMKVSTIDSELKELIAEISADEVNHLSWIADYLMKEKEAGNMEVAKGFIFAGELEDSLYRAHIVQLKNGTEFEQELAKHMEEQLPTYDYSWKRFLT